MNEKFYTLPEEKQRRIINAGFHVFSQNSYRKSPMSEIADAAGISKSLLFHYFLNKKELYLFLWEEGAKVTIQYLEKYGCYEKCGFFEQMERGMKAKLHIMNRYPDMGLFMLKAYYEKDSEVSGEIQECYQRYKNGEASRTFEELKQEDFVPGIDLEMMHRDMHMASTGYLWEIMHQQKPIQLEKLQQDFSKMIQFWKKIYTGKE